MNELTGMTIELAIKIHTAIGPGCFERVYEEILFYEMQKKGLWVERQVMMSIQYENFEIRNAYTLDLLVEKKLVVELKTAEHVLPIHFKQLTTYLKLLQLKNGILLNFKVNKMKEGIHRVFNNFGN